MVQEKKIKIAVILAGGLGKRLMPLTKNIPKSLIRINKKPFLGYIIDNLSRAGITKFLIVYRNNKKKFERFLKKYKFKAKLIPQPIPLGTGHALLLVKNLVSNKPFFVMAGDQLFSVRDLSNFINSNSTATIGAYHAKDSRKYGLLSTNPYGFLKRIIEKPPKKISGYVNVSLYKSNRKIFRYLSKIQLSERKEYELTDAFSMMAKQEKIIIYKLKDYWIDLGHIKDIPAIEIKLKNL